MANEFKIKKGLIVNGSGSTILDIQGSQGQLFSVTDNLSGSLFSVNDISGLPILQVSSDDSVKLGTYNAEAIKVQGSNAIITGSFSGSFSGNAFIQGGNSFGTTALLGTNDNQALALETSGSERMRITSAGDVGIGTTTPGSKLDVNGDIGYLAQSAIYPRQKSVASDWYLGKFNGGSLINNALGTSGDNAFQIGYYGGGTFAPNIKLSAGGNNISYINSGSVGIGTTTPTQKLDVIGSTKTDVLYLGSTSNYLDIATGMRLRSDANGINFVPNGTQAVKITGAGDVGIGKTTPNAKLDVSGSAIITGSLTVTNGITGSLFGTAATASYAPSYLPLTGGTITGDVTVLGTASIAFLNVQYESASVIYSSGSNVFGDATNDTQTLVGTVLVSGSQQITGSLNVSQGITGSLFGTSSWAVSASYISPTATNAFIQGGNSFGATALLGTNDNQSLAFETSGSERMFISSSGFVGIGTTSPRSRFHINSPTDTGYPTLGSQKGSFYLAGDNNLYGLMAGIDASSGTFWMQAMRNDIPTAYNILLNPVGGNVGIGKTVPSAKLDVSGSAIISGSFTVTPGTVREFQVNTTGVDIGNLITDRHTVTGSLNVSGSITGSLFGTSSWAISALTSSHSTNIAGVTNYIAKFTGTNTLSSSLIYDNGTAVMVGTTTPAARLTVTSAGTGTGINGTAIYAYSNGGPTIDAGAANSSSIVATNNSVNSSTLVAQNIGSGPIFSLKNNTDAVVVHVLNNGNVGIGTTTPTLGKLQVSGNVHATSFTGSLFGTSSWAVSASVSVNSKITDNPSFSSTYYPVFVQAAGNTNLQIDTSTFTYNPSTNLLTTTASFALTSSFLNGGTNAFVQNGNSFGTIATLGTNDNQSLQFETNNSTKMFISSSGNVGIGTTSPSERLTVSGSVNINSEGSYMGVDAQATPRLGFVKLSGAQPFLAFAQSSFDLRVSSGTTISTSNTFSPVLTVKTTGEVGIGTTLPDSKLTVGLRASTDGNIRLSAAGTGIDAGASLLWDMNVGGGNAISHLAEIRPESYATGANKNILNFYVGAWNNNADSGTTKMTITQDGTVGIGTINPLKRLDVVSSTNDSFDAIVLRPLNQTQTLSLGWEGIEASYNFIVKAGGSERMRIDIGGNVGIGTTTPTSKLHVVGDILGSTKLTIGSGHTNTGASSTIAGGVSNIASGNCSFVGGGQSNQASASYSTVGGGVINKASGSYSTVGGGENNYATGTYSTIAGGQNNQATNQYSTVAGGYDNQLTGYLSTIGGGYNNRATNQSATIAGGQSNSATGLLSTVGGGFLNKSTGEYSTIAGGNENQATGSYPTVGGGCKNLASGIFSSILGGVLNQASGQYSTVGGGVINKASGSYSTVGGGVSNQATGYISTIAGGNANCAIGYISTIAGGNSNQASGSYSIVGGGVSNQAKGECSFIGGGGSNIASGSLSGILGGLSNTVTHACSFAIGSSLTSTSGSTTYMNNATVACHLQVGGTTTMNTTTGRIDASNDVVAFATSDYRLKENIQPIKNALCKLIGVSGNTFDWKPLTQEEIQTIHGNKGRDVGVIAQEIEAILPEAVTTRDNGYKAVNYEKIIPLLIEAIKDQQKQIDELKSKL